MLDWLIIGGGIHGVHLAARLLGEAGIERDALRIIDPGTRLLERWRVRTEVTGMSHLRSPAVHHLDIDPWSLKHYATKKKTRKLGRFAPPYERPALALFNSHCDEVIDEYQLDALHLKSHASRIDLDCDGVTVELATGESITAQRVVLAMGSGESPEWPQWAPRNHQRVSHVFSTEFSDWPAEKETVLVAGGGISAGQVSLRLAHEGHSVHLVSRHDLRQHQFDSDPGWLGPKFMAGFAGEDNLEKRRAIISKARHKGSVPPDVWRALRRGFNDQRISWHQCTIQDVHATESGLNIQLSKGGSFTVDRILLATGFSSKRPGGKMIDELVLSAKLPCSSCGYPIVDEALRWHPRVHVSGPLAELELGPSSRNIAGARRAADRLVKSIMTAERLTRKAS